MDSKIHHCLMWTVIVSCVLVHADIGRVYVSLQYQMHQCICNSIFLRSCLLQQILCVQYPISRCLMYHEPSESSHEETWSLPIPHVEKQPLCGVINTGKKLMSHTWHIHVPSTFSLYVEFLHFYLPMSPNCKFGTNVNVIFSKHNSREETMLTYCGHRFPWHLSFLHSHAVVQYNKNYNTLGDFHFVMAFQAFDITLSSTVVTQLTEYENWSEIYYNNRDKWKDSSVLYYLINNRDKWHNYTNDIVSRLAYFSIGQECDLLETEVHIHIRVRIHYKIILSFSPHIFSKPTIHDGPGVLSPTFTWPFPLKLKPIVFNTAAYQAFIKYSFMKYGNLFRAYDRAQNNSYINKSYVNWKCDDTDMQVYGADYHGSGFRTKNVSGQHNFRYHLIADTVVTIHQMKFTGFNMMQHSSVTRHADSCQYGGLFVMHPNGTEYFKSCTNVTRSFTFPIGHKHDSHYISFITFKGYSSGFIDLMFTVNYECFGMQVVISRAPDCNNYHRIWHDEPYSYADQVLHNQCTELWLMNGIDYIEPSPFENCSFTLDHSLVPSLATPVNIITGTVSSYLNYHVDSHISPLLGDMYIEVNTFKSFHIRTATTKVKFAAPILMRNEYSFNVITHTVFSLNFSFYEQFPMFALKINFLSRSLICSPCSFHRHYDTRKWHIKHQPNKVLMLQTNDSNIDFYLPHHHPYDQISWTMENLELRGYNRGTCRLLLIGRMCSFSVPHNQIIRIHYYPSKLLVLVHEIDISMKKTLNSSIHCGLSVGISEFIDGNYTQRFRYYEWKGIYRLTWQVIAAESRGFSITINSTCSTCVKLCDITVALGLPLRSNLASVAGTYYDLGIRNSDFFMDILYSYEYEYMTYYDGMNYDDFQRIMLNITSLVEGITSQNATYGNWNDANAHCLAQNASLFTLTPFLSGQLKKIIDSQDLEHGWKYPKEHFFTGLHRDSLVCIPVITSLAKEVMFLVALVCLFVCLSVSLFVDNITQKVMNGC